MIDLDWIIILFVIHLDAFKVEKVEESTHMAIFTSWTILASWVLKPFGSILRQQMTFIGDNTLPL